MYRSSTYIYIYDREKKLENVHLGARANEQYHLMKCSRVDKWTCMWRERTLTRRIVGISLQRQKFPKP